MEKQEEIYEDEINMLDLLKVLIKRQRFIIRFAFVCTVLAVIISLIMTNIYQSQAIIMPVTQQGSVSGGAGMSAIAQLTGGLGISMPSSGSGQEVVNLLNSNVLREKMIERYKLMPILFVDQWDEKKQAWKKENIFEYIIHIPGKMIGFVRDIFVSKPKGLPSKEEGVPTIWDALETLNDIVYIKDDLVKANTITITVEWEDPAVAAKIVEYFLATLMDHMSAEAKRVAMINQKSLEQEIVRSADPVIKQNLYNMIAQQIQTSMLAEAKENFAFKVIDPPKVPDPDFKCKPKRALMVILAFVVSLFLAVFIVFFREYLEKNEEAKCIFVGEGEKLKDIWYSFLKRFHISKR